MVKPRIFNTKKLILKPKYQKILIIYLQRKTLEKYISPISSQIRHRTEH